MRTIYTNVEKTSRFSKGVRLYQIIFGVLIFGILAFLWVKLFTYQLHLDSEEQESVNEELFGVNEVNSEEEAQKCFLLRLENMTEDDWFNAYMETYPDSLDKEENIRSFISEKIINSGYECFKSADFSLTNPKYVLMAGDVQVAEFNVSGSEDIWSVDNISIDISGNSSYQAVIPIDAKLFINGKEVLSDNMGENVVTVEVSAYEEDLVEPKRFGTYTVSNLINEIDELTDVSVTSANGSEAKLAVDGIYYDILDEMSAVEYQEKADDFIKSLLSYYSRGKENAEGNMAAVRGKVVSGSAASSIITNSLSGVVWRVADYSVSYGTTVSDVYVLSDNCYCVDVAYETVSESNTYETGNGVYRVYFLDGGNGFGIVQFAGIQ